MSITQLGKIVSRRWPVFAVVLLLGLAAVVLSTKIAPHYVATASVMIPESRNQNPDQQTVDALQIKSFAKSTAVLDHVRRQLNLPISVADMSKNLSLRITQGTSVLPISYRDTDRQRAVNVANAIAEEVSSYYRQMVATGYDKLAASLSQQRDQERARIKAIDTRIQRATADNVAVGDRDPASALSQRIQDLIEARAKAAAQLSADSAVASAAARGEQQLQPLYQTELLQQNPGYQSMADAAAKDAAALAAAKAQYTDENPTVVALKDKVSREQGALAALRQKVLSGGNGASGSYAKTAVDVNRARANVEGDKAALSQADQQLSRLQSQLATLPTTGVVVGDLRRERDAAQDAYTAIVGKLNEALSDRSQAISLGSILVIDRANLSQVALPASFAVRAIAIMLGALVLAIVAVIAAEMMDRRLERATDIEALYGQPVLALVGGRGRSLQRRFRDALRFVRSEIEVSTTEPTMIVVTSAQPGDGKSAVAAELARSFAECGRRTLLVDANHKRPTLSRPSRLLALEPGSASTMLRLPSGVVTDERAVDPDDANGEERVPAPRLLETLSIANERIAQGASADMLRELATDLLRDHDIVVVDAGEIADDGLTLQLGTLANGVIIAVRADRSATDADHRLQEAMRRLDMRVFGVVASPPVSPTVERGEILEKRAIASPSIAPAANPANI